jgi:hypothetical protein
MCPVCIANIAMIAGGVASTSGLTAFVATRLRALRVAAKSVSPHETEGENDGTPENRVTR